MSNHNDCNTNPPTNQPPKNRAICPEPTPVQLAKALAVLSHLRAGFQNGVSQSQNNEVQYSIPLSKLITEIQYISALELGSQETEDAVNVLVGRGDVILRAREGAIDVCVPYREGYQPAPDETAKVVGVEVSSD